MQDTKTAAPVRLALYARVSTDEQKEGQTIDSQVAELERFAAERGWPVVELYKDEGWSGALVARPALDRLRDEAGQGRFDAVLLNDVDRLARDVVHLGVIKRDLERHGLQVLFRKLPAESSPTQNLMINILGSFAEFERELIADRTRRGRKHKVEVRQQYLGSNTAYGYRYVPKDQAAGQDGYLDVIPEEASVVRQMFGWVEQEGLSARQVLRRLNEHRIRPRRGARTWGKSSVLRILRNEMYAGTWYYNKHRGAVPETPRNKDKYRQLRKSSTRQRPKEEWIPLPLPDSLRLVSRDQWARVQQQLNRNITFSPRNERHAYLLKGLVQCGGCGGRYVGDPAHGRFSYRCIQRCKKRPAITEERLNETVWEAIEEVLQNPKLVIDQAKRYQEQHQQAPTRHESAQKETERGLAQVEAEEGRLLAAYRQGVITAAQLGRELEIIGQRKRLLEQDYKLQSSEKVNWKGIRKSIEEYGREACDRVRRIGAAKQQVLRLLVRQVVFDGTQVQVRGEFPAEVCGRGDAEEGDGQAGGRIAATRIGRRARNSAPVCIFRVSKAIRPWQRKRCRSGRSCPNTI